MTDLSKVIKELEALGIHDVKEVVYNPSYEQLFEEETKPGLDGFEKGTVTTTGAVAVDTGIFTGRSPKDKYIVDTPGIHNKIAWGNVNKPIEKDKFDSIYNKLIAYLGPIHNQFSIRSTVRSGLTNLLGSGFVPIYGPDH